LPSVFDHPLNSSDWTLRLSSTSLTSDHSDQSTSAQRRVTIDDYMTQFAYKLGTLDSDSDERVSQLISSHVHCWFYLIVAVSVMQAHIGYDSSLIYTQKFGLSTLISSHF